MYIKVSTGSSFGAAAQYNETGLSPEQQKQKAGRVRYLDGYNLLADDARGIAAEMGAVASRSRTQQPVWNVSFSAADGQQLTDQQWLGVVERYLTEIGTSTDRHQVAVWHHSDTGRDHIHALINAVPTDGERALKRYQCGIRAKQAAQQIDTSLAQPIQKGVGIREIIAQAIRTALTETKITTFDELVTSLNEVGITATIKLNATGGGGTRFKMGDHKPIKGSMLGYKFAAVANQLAANQAYQTEIDQLKQALEEAKKQPVKPEMIPTEEIKSTPKDTAEIERLKKVEKDLIEKVNTNYKAWEREKKRADKVPETITEQIEVMVPDPADKDTIDKLTRAIGEKNTKITTLIKNYNDLVRKSNELAKLYNELIKKEPGQQPTPHASATTPTTPAVARSGASSPVAQAAAPPLTATERWLASFKGTFKVDPTPEQLQDIIAKKQVPIPQIGLTVWVGEGKWQCKPIRSVATAPLVAQTPVTPRPPVPPKTATPAPEPAPTSPTVSHEPDWYELFRTLTRQKKSYMGAWDLQKHLSDSRAINALKLTLHQENGELCLTDQHDRTATFTQLGLDWKKLGITGLDKNNIADLKKARGKGQGRSL